MPVHETTKRQLHQGAPSQLLEGVVLDPPKDASGFLRVEVDGQPGVAQAAPWMPRLDVDPLPGDAVVVSESDRGVYWATQWWPQSNNPVKPYIGALGLLSVSGTPPRLNVSGGVTITGGSGKTTLELQPTTPTADVGITLGGDTTLYRPSANRLKTDGALEVAGSLWATAGVELQAASGQTQSIHFRENSTGQDWYIRQLVGGTLEFNKENTGAQRFAFTGGGQLQLPIGGNTAGLLIGGDTNLYRSAPTTLRTDSDFAVGGNLTVTGTSTLTGTVTLGTGRFADGSAAAPGIAFSGDTDTGIFRASENYATLGAGGSSVLRWTLAVPGQGSSAAVVIGQTTPSDLYQLRLYRTLDDRDPGSTAYAIYADPIYRPNAAGAVRSFRGIAAVPRVRDTFIADATDLTSSYIALYGSLQVEDTAATRTVESIYGLYVQTNSTPAALATVTTARGGYFYGGAVYGNWTTWRGIEIAQPAVQAGPPAGSVGTATMLFINNVTAGATNWSIYSNGGPSYHAGELRLGTTGSGGGLLAFPAGATTPTNGIWFGTDVNLYRSAGATLRTDGTFFVGGDLDFGAVGVAAPGAAGTDGWKVNLYDYRYGFGIESGALWYLANDTHIFYSGGSAAPVERARINATGLRTAYNITLTGAGTGNAIWGAGTTDPILYQNANQDTYVNARVIRGRGLGTSGDGMYINYGASTGAGSNAQPIRFYINGSTSEHASFHTNGLDVGPFRCGASQAHGSTYASWSHSSQHGQSVGYAMLQHSGGDTFLNSPSATRIRYRNSDRMIAYDDRVEFWRRMRMLDARGSSWSWDWANLELRSQGAGGYGASVAFHSPNNCAPQLTGHTDNNFYLMNSSGGLTGIYGSFFSTSGEEFKRNFRPLDKRAVLDKVKALPVRSFDWKEDRGLQGQVLHPPRPGMGATAQDMVRAFPELKGPGALFSDSAISVSDAIGLLLASVQGLVERLEAVEARLPQPA